MVPLFTIKKNVVCVVVMFLGGQLTKGQEISNLMCCSFMTISVLSQLTDHLQLLVQLAK